jgi:hypothetical protein
MGFFSTICAVTPDRQALWRYDGRPDRWTRMTRVGWRAGEIYSGSFGLFQIDRTPGSATYGHILWWRLGTPSGAGGGSPDFAWYRIGLPGAMFAVADSVYGLTPNRGAVWRYDRGTASSWTQVGGAAGWLWGGTYGLVASNPINGNIFRYRGFDRWEFIGGPGAEFAVTAESVYGLTPDRQRVYRYNGFESSWTQISAGVIGRLYGGDFGLVATFSVNGIYNLFRHLGGPNNWQFIGGPGASFAVTRDTVYGLTPDRGAVYRYDGFGSSWTRVGGAADSIYAFEEHDDD